MDTLKRSHSISSQSTQALRRTVVIGFDGSKYADNAIDYLSRNILQRGADHVVFAVALSRKSSLAEAAMVFEQMGVTTKGPAGSTSAAFQARTSSPVGAGSPAGSRPGSPGEENPYKELPILDLGTTDLDQVRFYSLLEQVTQAKIEQCKAKLEAMDIIVSVDIRPGDPRTVLMKICEETSAELLVVGSRGLGAFKRALVGSVSEWLVQNSKTAVLVVRKKKTKKPKA